METKKPSNTRASSEVWFVYRSSGDNTTHKIRVTGKVANRWLRKLNRLNSHKKLPQFSKRIDYMQVEGLFEPEESLKEARIHLQVSQSNVFRETQVRKLQEEEEQEIIARHVTRTGKIVTQRMSFHIGKLEQAVIVLCPVTGIVGKLEMPYCPVALSYDHPLAKAGNVLNLLRNYFSIAGQKDDLSYISKHGSPKLDRQTLAGCLLSLLKAKGLLWDLGETNAAERNMVLQNAGHHVLSDLLKAIVYYWDNTQVWTRLPRLSVDWSVHSKADANIAGTLQNYEKLIRHALDPADLSPEEQAKIFTAQARRREQRQRYNSVRIYSAQTVETRKIKEAKTEGRDLFEMLKPHLPIALRLQVSRVLQNLLLLPQETKNNVARSLRVLFVGKPQASVAIKLAATIEAAKNERLLGDLGTMSMELGTAPRSKSISEILEAKRLRAQDKAEAKAQREAEEAESQEEVDSHNGDESSENADGN